MDKKKVISTIVEACNAIGWDIIKNYKSDSGKWKADVLIKYEKYNVAINVYKRESNFDGMREAMKEDRTCGCWLILGDRRWIPDKNEKYPCFSITEENNATVVKISHCLKLEIREFMSLLVEGKITQKHEFLISAIDVIFPSYTCYKCKKEFHYYSVERIVSDDNVVLDCKNDSELANAQNNFSELNPIIVNSIQKYLANHKEKNIAIGKIKPRYSRTIDESYMSFGCAHCDALLGNFYRSDDYAELQYYISEDDFIRVKLDEPIRIRVNCWIVNK